jgi:hypothetical protein
VLDAAQAEQRKHKEELLAGIREKMNQLLNSGGAHRTLARCPFQVSPPSSPCAPGAARVGDTRKRDHNGDTLREALAQCNELLMNLEHVISDDDIRADIDKIYKVRPSSVPVPASRVAHVAEAARRPSRLG